MNVGLTDWQIDRVQLGCCEEVVLKYKSVGISDVVWGYGIGRAYNWFWVKKNALIDEILN